MRVVRTTEKSILRSGDSRNVVVESLVRGDISSPFVIGKGLLLWLIACPPADLDAWVEGHLNQEEEKQYYNSLNGTIKTNRVMNRDKLSVEYLPTTKESTFIKAKLFYDKGGMNYFSGKEERRGYYLSVSPVERSGNIETYTMFTGTKVFISSAKRFSKKVAENHMLDFSLRGWRTDYDWLLDRVLEDNKLTLETT